MAGIQYFDFHRLSLIVQKFVIKTAGCGWNRISAKNQGNSKYNFTTTLSTYDVLI